MDDKGKKFIVGIFEDEDIDNISNVKTGEFNQLYSNLINTTPSDVNSD